MTKWLLTVVLLALPASAFAQAQLQPSGIFQVQDEGTNQPFRIRVNFTGAGIACSDDAANGRINCAHTPDAPTDATYLVASADATLSAEVVVTPTDDNTMVGNGSTWEIKALPSCSNGTTSKLLYDTATNAFSCGTDQGGAGGGLSHDQVMSRSSLGF